MEKIDSIEEAKRQQRMDIIRKIIGKVIPVAETNEDARRLANLKELHFIMNELLDDVLAVAILNSRTEHSLVVASCEAIDIFSDLKLLISNFEEDRD